MGYLTLLSTPEDDMFRPSPMATPTWMERSVLWLGASTAALLAVTVARLSWQRPDDGIELLYLLPIALAALRFGAAGGLACAVCAAAAIVGWDLREEQVSLGVAGIAVRASALLVIGACIGVLARTSNVSSRRIRRFFDLSPDLLGTVDDDGFLTAFNDSWTSVLGYTRDEMASVSLRDRVHPDDREAAIAAGRRIREEGLALVNYDVRYVAKDGTPRWIEAYAIPSPDESLLYLAARDVTERQRARTHIRRLLVELQRTREDERQRIAGELHDFSLQHLAAGLMRLDEVRHHIGHGDPERAEHALRESESHLRQASDSARRIVDGLQPLDFDHMDIGLALRDLADDVQRTYDVPIVSSITAKGDIDPEARMVVYRVISEALHNAGKHASASRIVLTVLLSERSITANIMDDGMGFDSAVSVRNEPIPSLGLGLSLILEQCLALGGSYVVDSTPGHGTSIQISLSPGETTPGADRERVASGVFGIPESG